MNLATEFYSQSWDVEVFTARRATTWSADAAMR